MVVSDPIPPGADPALWFTSIQAAINAAVAMFAPTRDSRALVLVAYSATGYAENVAFAPFVDVKTFGGEAGEVGGQVNDRIWLTLIVGGTFAPAGAIPTCDVRVDGFEIGGDLNVDFSALNAFDGAFYFNGRAASALNVVHGLSTYVSIRGKVVGATATTGNVGTLDITEASTGDVSVGANHVLNAARATTNLITLAAGAMLNGDDGNFGGIDATDAAIQALRATLGLAFFRGQSSAQLSNGFLIETHVEGFSTLNAAGAEVNDQLIVDDEALAFIDNGVVPFVINNGTQIVSCKGVVAIEIVNTGTGQIDFHNGVASGAIVNTGAGFINAPGAKIPSSADNIPTGPGAVNIERTGVATVMGLATVIAFLGAPFSAVGAYRVLMTQLTGVPLPFTVAPTTAASFTITVAGAIFGQTFAYQLIPT